MGQGQGLACYGWVNEEFGRGEWMCLYTSTGRHGMQKAEQHDNGVADVC